MLHTVYVINVKQGVPDLSQFGDVYELGFGLGPEQPPTSAIVKKEFQRKIIYQMSPQEVILWQLSIDTTFIVLVSSMSCFGMSIYPTPFLPFFFFYFLFLRKDRRKLEPNMS